MKLKLTVTLGSMIVALGVATVVSWRQPQSQSEHLSQSKQAEEARTLAPLLIVQEPAHEFRPSIGSDTAGLIPEGTRSMRAGSAAAALDLHGIEDLREWYPDLAADLGITQAEADDFLRLLARQRVTTAELVGRREPSGAAGLDQIVRQMRHKIRADEEEQASVLGGRYSLWLEQQAKATALLQAKELTQFVKQGASMGEDESRLFTVAMAAEVANVNERFRDRLQARSADEPAVALSIREEMRRETDARTISVAASYLSSVQLDRFKQALIARERRAKYVLGEAR